MNNNTQIVYSKSRRLLSSLKETAAKFAVLRDSTIPRPSGSVSQLHNSPTSTCQSKTATEEHSRSSPDPPCPPRSPSSPNPYYPPCPPSRPVSKTQEMLFASLKSSCRPVSNSCLSM